MEQRIVVRFLTLKGLRAFALAAELNSIDETEALAPSTVEKWRKRFAERRVSLYDNPRCGRPLTITNNLAEAISSMLKERPSLFCKVLCPHLRIAKATCLRILPDTLGMKSSIFIGFPMPWT
jgi:transposase